MTRMLGILFPLHPCPSAQSVVNRCLAVFVSLATALFASPRQASAMPARPTPNFFSAARRVTDWAIFLVSSSNLFCITFFGFDLFDVLLVHANRGSKNHFFRCIRLARVCWAP